MIHGPDSHDCQDVPWQDLDDIIGDDAEFLEIIGSLRGSPMVDDEVESSESDSECQEKPHLLIWKYQLRYVKID